MNFHLTHELGVEIKNLFQKFEVRSVVKFRTHREKEFFTEIYCFAILYFRSVTV